MGYSKYIKWVLMILGAIRFNMFGAFIGFFLGIFIEELIEGKSSLFGSLGSSQNNKELELSAYQSNLIRLIAALLKDQPIISRNESHYILKYFYRQFGTKKGKFVFQGLKRVLTAHVNYIGAAQGLNTLQRAGKIQVVQFLFGLTQQTPNTLEPQESILEDIAKNMGMAQQDFEKIKRQKQSEKRSYVNYVPSHNPDRYYKVLGVQKGVSSLELKKAYRRLVLKYHPDKTIIAKDVAATKFQEVQEAYDLLRIQLGIK